MKHQLRETFAGKIQQQVNQQQYKTINKAGPYIIG